MKDSLTSVIVHIFPCPVLAPPAPPLSTSLFSALWVCFCFAIHICFIFLDAAYKSFTGFEFLCLIHFTKHNILLGPSMMLQKAECHLFSQLSSIPFCIYTSFWYIHLLMDVCVASVYWLFYIVLLWTSGCMNLFQLVLSLWIYTSV